jgi:hypothetical protein
MQQTAANERTENKNITDRGRREQSQTCYGCCEAGEKQITLVSEILKKNEETPKRKNITRSMIVRI